ncbi:hypothetical protein G6F57_006655 [Rhizopus arrhizus]|uniref:BHLH domain-containing protein n=1 Tax=Rhizopus oryzae TaxID=64495 RepID=A0A9P7BS16_RHIOR|nr:hypothetical protein G6F23_001319 [Rhizopus arrhizus]KAG1423714.1 hypothetical protein G6F58_002702 [Rhizopus delemar]KAG0763105.1 hypothetical protein G6F24_006286 [Rhizopus arrhizus]KAG0789624.1 hypothetical protein G6F21_006385 [Rhizopus arrhizus]KAG0799047.1 hypothetical protein G6F22_003618 [Rhizopus arrhizus]
MTSQQEQASFMNALLMPGKIPYNNKRAFEDIEAIQQESSLKKERKPRKALHELLTDKEKKANHIASEKKRRQNIKLGFDQLIEIVPSLTEGNRSEALILQKSVDHIKHLVGVKDDLKSQIKSLQSVLGESNFDDEVSGIS